jgi:hypothetical protein
MTEMAHPTCNESRGLILAFLLEILHEEVRGKVARHLAGCLDCMTRLERAQADLNLLRCAPEEQPPLKAVQSVLAECRMMSGRKGDAVATIEESLRELESLMMSRDSIRDGSREPTRGLSEEERLRISRELGLLEDDSGPGLSSDEFVGAENAFSPGTTVLLPCGSSPRKRRTSSRLLADIRSEDGERRISRKRRKRKGFVTIAVFAAISAHVAVLLILRFSHWFSKEPIVFRPVQVTLKEVLDSQPLTPIPAEKPRESPTRPNPKHRKPNPSSGKRSGESSPGGEGKGTIGVKKPKGRPVKTGIKELGLRRRAGTGGKGGSHPAVDKALAWFAVHQDDDGKWSWAGYTRHCRRHGGPMCRHGIEPSVAREGRNFTPGITGLVLLCYLGSGYTHTALAPETGLSEEYMRRHERYRPLVRKALAYLKGIQGQDGCFGRKGDMDFEGYMYNHGICSLALIEAYHLSEDTSLREKADCAVRFIAGAQNPASGGWDYRAYAGRKHTRTDVSVSSWQVMALKAAQDAGLTVNAKCIERARRFFRRMRLDRGWFQYVAGNRAETDAEHRSRRSEGITAAGLLSHIYLGEPLSKIRKHPGIGLLLGRLPNTFWLSEQPPEKNTFNFHTTYYWYYGTLVMFQVGGQEWKSWREHLLAALEGSRDLKGFARGTWASPNNLLGTYAGRLAVTAFNVLSLEVEYRCLPIYRD